MTDPIAELRSAAADGVDLVIALGPAGFEVASIAPEFPEVTWAFIEGPGGTRPLGRYVSFAEQEGSFLADRRRRHVRLRHHRLHRRLPDRTDRTVPSRLRGRRWAVDPDVEILASYVSAGPGIGIGFRRQPTARAPGTCRPGCRCRAAAGASGAGVIEAARTTSLASGEQHWAIGVDADQYFEVDVLRRPFILTSMVQRYDLAIRQLLERFTSGDRTPGADEMTLADEGIAAVDEWQLPLAGSSRPRRPVRTGDRVRRPRRPRSPDGPAGSATGCGRRDRSDRSRTTAPPAPTTGLSRSRPATRSTSSSAITPRPQHSPV